MPRDQPRRRPTDPSGLQQLDGPLSACALTTASPATPFPSLRPVTCTSSLLSPLTLSPSAHFIWSQSALACRLQTGTRLADHRSRRHPAAAMFHDELGFVSSESQAETGRRGMPAHQSSAPGWGLGGPAGSAGKPSLTGAAPNGGACMGGNVGPPPVDGNDGDGPAGGGLYACDAPFAAALGRNGSRCPGLLPNGRYSCSLPPATMVHMAWVMTGMDGRRAHRAVEILRRQSQQLHCHS